MGRRNTHPKSYLHGLRGANSPPVLISLHLVLAAARREIQLVRLVATQL